MEGWYLKLIDCERTALACAEILGSGTKAVGSVALAEPGSVIETVVV